MLTLVVVDQKHDWFPIWVTCHILSFYEFRIDITVQPYKSDVLVSRNGTVDHAVNLFIAVSCDINLFTYPFVIGNCPVAINGWNQSSKMIFLNEQ